MFDRLADLPLIVDGYSLHPLAITTSGGWVRETTVVRLSGGGHEGQGEDVTYEARDQRKLLARGPEHALAGSWTFASFSEHLGTLELFAEPPATPWNVDFRRWAFESAALDLALRQAGQSLANALEREPTAPTFVVSLGLGEPPGLGPIEAVLERVPDARFKVDLGDKWTADTIRALASIDRRIAVVDYKGLYRGAFHGPAANAAVYAEVATRLPGVWIEDPALDGDTDTAMAAHRDRITWDANLHTLADLETLPFAPRCINIKPSRFATVRELLAVYEHCERSGIRMYGGGQFELGPGRGQIQLLASLFHPDAPNDIAPGAYNLAELPRTLPGSPLPAPTSVPGFRWADQ